jgi:hypothetical protein
MEIPASGAQSQDPLHGSPAVKIVLPAIFSLAAGAAVPGTTAQGDSLVLVER